MELLFATHNRAKLLEAEALLQLESWDLLSAFDLPTTAEFDVDETGSTFAENAELKARAFGKKAGLLTASDDSGLEVTALGGKPGVHSKRFLPGTDEDRNQALLRLLAKESDRSARFVTVICLYDPVADTTHFFEGIIEGEIALASAGNQGFGFDPLFIPAGYHRTFGELGLEVKNKLSHRAQALYQLKEYLQKLK